MMRLAASTEPKRTFDGDGGRGLQQLWWVEVMGRWFFRVSPFEAHYLSADFDGIDLDGKTLLEIGVGNGSMLAWAKAKGH
jgi:hypothetical protein